MITQLLLHKDASSLAVARDLALEKGVCLPMTTSFSCHETAVEWCAIIESFAPRFIQEPIVVYIGDTAEKALHIDKDFFEANYADVTNHDKLPDVVIYDKKRKWLFLIEAVTSHGPMNPKRIFELQKMFEECSIGKVYVSSFLDFTEFKKHSKEISWETEVWISDFPDHMIHFNGDRFLGPR